jgi:formate-dependent nitrite reductase membrane component NrfD
MVLYLFMKAVSTGAMLVAALLWMLGLDGTLLTVVAPIVSILFVTATAVVLIADLERPERFFYILTKSNWRSWMVWGAWFLTLHGALSAAWLFAGWFGTTPLLNALVAPVLVIVVLATSYTGFLFAQGLGRDLWQGPHSALHLIAQSGIAGSALLLISSPLGTHDATAEVMLMNILLLSLLAHLVILVFDNLFAPSPTRHHELALETIRRGAYSRLFWGVAIGAGGVLPLVLAGAELVIATPALTPLAAAVLALAGSAAWDYIWVEAGQSVPLS